MFLCATLHHIDTKCTSNNNASRQSIYTCTFTVNLVYKDHPRDQENVVFIHRWSLYAGSIKWKVYTWGPVKCGLYKQVVFIYRWSVEQVSLYFLFIGLLHCTTTIPVHLNCLQEMKRFLSAI